jgi:hypothetical protein
MFYAGIQGLYTGRIPRRAESKPGVRQDILTDDERLAIYKTQQQDGQYVYIDREQQPEFAVNVDDNAAWDAYRLVQHSCDSYTITKRAAQGCAYITAAQGGRSNGGVFFGSEAAKVTAVVKDFWQKSPMALELTGCRSEAPVMTLWLWSRYAEAMDFRAYDVVGHKYSYGGINNVPQGIANTNEIFFKFFHDMPGKRAILDFAADVQTDSLLVAAPEIYEDSAALGSYWVRPKTPELTDTPQQKGILQLIRYYINEVEQRRWYGFWDYGDVMHTYDPVRHCWRYDVGGYAWNNNELLNTYSGWLAFLRTGDYDIYRYARAMSRHCSEVDVYHSGFYAMLGTRHNVRHWGCGAKEPRISTAGHFRFFYYLTADERIGDVMDLVKDVDLATLNRDPMGSYFTRHDNYSHVRVGPDWSSFMINWLTRWERFEDEAYRDKLLRSLESVKRAPLGLSSGSTFHYDPATGIMHYMGEENPAGHTHLGDGNYQQHMVVCFGGPELWFELADLLDDDELRDNIARFGQFYAMTPEQRQKASDGRFNPENDRAWNGLHFAADMCAYAGYRFNDEHCMETALRIIDAPERMEVETIDGEIRPIYKDVPDADSPYPLNEAHIFTGGSARWSLNVMETMHFLEMLRDLRLQA